MGERSFPDKSRRQAGVGDVVFDVFVNMAARAGPLLATGLVSVKARRADDILSTVGHLPTKDLTLDSSEGDNPHFFQDLHCIASDFSRAFCFLFEGARPALIMPK